MAALWLLSLANEAFRRGDGLNGAQRAAGPALARYATATLLTLVLYLPWLPSAVYQLTVQPNISERVPMDLLLRQIQGWLAFGNTFEESIGGMGAVIYFLLLFGLLVIPPQAGPSRASWKTLFPVVWVLAAVLPFLYLGFYLRYLRFLLPAQIGFALWMGRGVWVLWTVQTRERTAPVKLVPRVAAVFGTLGLLVNMSGGLAPLYGDSAFRRDDYRGMAQAIMDEAPRRCGHSRRA
jgi:hypothetical protein